ncbi:MAG: hypothetical protein AVDCRST_MAG41-1754, partial [uncultured Corynebacteriales bacterium]
MGVADGGVLTPAGGAGVPVGAGAGGWVAGAGVVPAGVVGTAVVAAGPVGVAGVVAAAGNYGTDKPVWPAAARGVVAVGALTQSMLPAPWSSHGHWVDCSVIGDGVLSVYVEGQED